MPMRHKPSLLRGLSERVPWVNLPSLVSHRQGAPHQNTMRTPIPLRLLRAGEEWGEFYERGPTR